MYENLVFHVVVIFKLDIKNLKYRISEVEQRDGEKQNNLLFKADQALSRKPFQIPKLNADTQLFEAGTLSSMFKKHYFLRLMRNFKYILALTS